ncbi:MAG TPA: DUF4123 domain-containing protein [Thermoanaerobaculia bacterium]|nr:DUF4123 domain-containing protein [Thermoanaerobaculia bacterium]
MPAAASQVETLPGTFQDLARLAAEKKLYAVLDACASPAILAKVEGLGPDLAPCLYRGNVDPKVLAVAPYVAAVDPPLLDWLRSAVWAEPWGIFVATPADLKTVRTHLRKFLTVKSPEGAPFYFRYYDPRVLPTFLGSCNRKELAEFFGPVLAYAFPLECDRGITFLRSQL